MKTIQLQTINFTDDSGNPAQRYLAPEFDGPVVMSVQVGSTVTVYEPGDTLPEQGN